MLRSLALLAALITCALTAADASASVPLHIWTNKYKVVSVSGSQNFSGSYTVDDLSYSETTSASFSNKKSGQLVWDSNIDMPLKGTASTDISRIGPCSAQLNLATFPDGVKLRLFITQKNKRVATIEAQYLYRVQKMDDMFCDNDSIFNHPLNWGTQVLVFGTKTMPYSTLRKDNVTVTLNTTKPGWISQAVATGGVSGSDSYSAQLTVKLKKTKRLAPK